MYIYIYIYIYNNRITMEQFHELFDQSDHSDEEFKGF